MVYFLLILGWLCAEGIKPCSETNVVCYIWKKWFGLWFSLKLLTGTNGV